MPNQLDSKLHTPDDPAWQEEPGYSSRVRLALQRAYNAIAPHDSAGSSIAGFQKARAALAPYVSQPMSPSQRLCVTYVLAMASAAEHDYVRALEALDAALNLVEQVGNRGAFAELTYLHAAANRASCQIAEAAKYYTMCLGTLWELEVGEDAPVDVALELGALVDLAAAYTLLANFEQAAGCLQAAKALVPHAPKCRLEAGMIPWVQAVLSRYQGDISHALADAVQACDAYAVAAAGSPAAQARIQTVVADIALDLAEQFPAGHPYSGRAGLLTLARPYVQNGVRLAREGHDPVGEGLAVLAQARYYRLSKRNVSRTRLIAAALRTADTFDDPPLRGQAHMALGQELAAQGATSDAQIACYDRAVEALGACDLRAIQMLARREALRAREMRDS